MQGLVADKEMDEATIQTMYIVHGLHIQGTSASYQTGIVYLSGVSTDEYYGYSRYAGSSGVRAGREGRE